MMNFNKILVLSFALILNLYSAQVGIGTPSPDASAILHLNNDSKGFLMTQIALKSTTDTTTIPNPATGLLVWNKGTGGLSAQGFYYWSNNQWNLISTGTNGGGTSSGWSSSGNNAGNNTGAATPLSFGTSTFDDLVFKVNGAVAGRLGTTAVENIAFGNGSSAPGYQSIAIGKAATTTANNEIAIGNGAKTSSQNSTALGSGAAANGQFSTAIGYNATTSQANALVLGNTNTNVGVGTSTPNTNAKLDLAGQYKLGTNGTVQKNLISFEVIPSGINFSNVASGAIKYVDVDIPTANQPTSTKATIVTSPAPSFDSNFAVISSRLLSTSKVRVFFMNISAAPASIYTADLYFTLNEFL